MSKKTNTVQKRERLLKKLVVLNRYTSKNDLLEAVNKHFKQEPITLSALSGYINDCELKHTNDGYIIEDPKILSETINDLFASYKKNIISVLRFHLLWLPLPLIFPCILLLFTVKQVMKKLPTKDLRSLLLQQLVLLEKSVLCIIFLMMLMQSKLMIILTRTNSDIDMEPLEAWPSALVGRYSRPQGAGATILPTPYQYFTSSELFPVIPVQKIDIIS